MSRFGPSRNELAYHRSLLEDEVRVVAFEKAIRATVRSGDHVLEVGTGTGILSMLAIRCGAARVTSVEQGGMAEVARDVVRANGMDDRITVERAWSRDVTLTEPVDVVVVELIGPLGLDEGILGHLGDAIERLAKPKATIVPSSLRVCAAPVFITPEYEDNVAAWDSLGRGFNFRPVKTFAVEAARFGLFNESDLAADPRTFFDVDLTRTCDPYQHGEHTMTVRSAGTLSGICVWFDATLTEGVTLTNAPFAPRTSWDQGLLPLLVPLDVLPGDHLALSLSTHDGAVWSWKGALTRAGLIAGEFSHSSIGSLARA